MTETAEQQNQKRRATKARQQAVIRAKAVNKTQNQEFDLQGAAADSRKRANWQSRAAQNQQQAIVESFASLTRSKALQIERGSNLRESWVNHCFGVIQLIRTSSEPYVYNRDWKEVGVFLVGIAR